MDHPVKRKAKEVINSSEDEIVDEEESEVDMESNEDESEGMENDGDDEANETEKDGENPDEEEFLDEDNPLSEHKIILAQDLRAQLNQEKSLTAIRSYFLQKNNYNHVGEYIKSGGSVGELMEEMTKFNVKKKPSTAIIFSAVNQVIIKVLTEFPDMQSSLADDCRSFISNYVNEIGAMVTPHTVMKYQKIAMNLLTALATVNDQTASQLISLLDFQKETLTHIVEHYNPLDKESLRVYFMQFLMALMIGHDKAVLNKLCGKKGWITSVFPNMKYDILSNAVLFLKTLEKRIILNKDVSKTSKLYVFNSHALEHLTYLYAWDPKSFLETRKVDKKLKIEETNPEDMETIRKCVHRVLIAVCTSTKLGVVFSDSGLGSGGASSNQLLNQFLKTLGQPWEDLLKKELVCQILKSCPDLIKPFLTLLSPYLKPASPKYFKAVNLVSEVLSSVDIDSSLVLKNPFKIVQNVFLPYGILNAITAEPSFSISSVKSRLCVYEILLVALDKIEKIIDSLQNRKNNFIDAVTHYLITNAPNAEFIFNCLKKEFTEKNLIGLDSAIKTLLCLNRVVPQFLDIIRFNKDGLTFIQEAQDFLTDEENSAIIESGLKEPLILRLIKLEIILNPQVLKKDGSIRKINIIYTLLKSPESQVHTLAEEAMKELFDKTGFFYESEVERDLWIYCLNIAEDDDCGELITKSLIYANKHKYRICNMVLRAQGDNNELTSDTSINLDNFIAMAKKEEQKDEMYGLSKNVGLALSPLLPSALHLTSSKDKPDEILIMFMIHYLHSLDSSVVFNSLINNNPCPSSEKVISYLSSWSKKPTVVDFNPFRKSIYHSISNYLLYEDKKIELSQMENEDSICLELMFKLILFTLKQSSKFGPIKEFTISKAIELVNVILKNPKFISNVNDLLYGLLDYFHPTSLHGFNKFIMEIMIILNDKISKEILNLYSNRLCFELEMEKKNKSYLKTLDLKILISHLQLTEENVLKLSKIVFKMNEKYIESNGVETQWVYLINYLLGKGAEYKIDFEDDQLLGVASKIKYLHNKNIGIKELCSGFTQYFKITEKECSGELVDGLSDLFKSVIFGDNWYEDLSQFLVQILETNTLEIPELLPLNKLIISLSALNGRGNKYEYLFHCHVKPIAKLFMSDHDWIHNLKLVVDNIFSSALCEKICTIVSKKAHNVHPSKNNLDVMKTIFSKCDLNVNFTSLVHNWLLEHKDEDLCENICSVYLNLLLYSNMDPSSLPDCSQDILRHLILHGLSGPSPPMLDLINHWSETKLENISNQDCLSTQEVFELVCAHSKFVSLLMQKGTAKNSLLKLILTLINKNEGLPQTSHLSLFYAAYHATLSHSDQLILMILQKYEKCGVNVSSFSPIVWSETALEHTVNSTGNKSNKSATLEHLDMSMIEKTIAEFPLHRDLHGFYEPERDDLYDPAFLLPVLCQLIEPGSKIPIRKLFLSGALSIAFASFASTQPNIRAAAYYFIKMVYETMPNGRENIVWKHFINSIRQGTKALKSSDDNKRHSSIVTTFLAKASLIMADPLNPMFGAIHNFVYAKAAMNLNAVPAFLELFNNTNFQRETQQIWVLEVLKHGLRETSDIKLALNQFIFKIILDYHSSTLASKKIKNLIEEIVAKCLTEADKEGHFLINNYSILPWIYSAGKKPILINSLPSKFSSNYKYIANFVACNV